MWYLPSNHRKLKFKKAPFRGFFVSGGAQYNDGEEFGNAQGVALRNINGEYEVTSNGGTYFKWLPAMPCVKPSIQLKIDLLKINCLYLLPCFQR